MLRRSSSSVLRSARSSALHHYQQLPALAQTRQLHICNTLYSRSTHQHLFPLSNTAAMSDFIPPPVFSETRSASTSTSPQQSTDGQTRVLTHNQYQSSGLDTSDLLPSPLALFQKWFDLVSSSDAPVPVNEPEAMLLCTSAVNSTGIPIPSSRVVLLKSIHPQEGLTFYSNYTSRKGREIQANPFVSCTFYWRETSQSVRFLGKARKVSKEESQEYFDTRPVGSRIGAWASPQSSTIQSRSELEEKVLAKEKEFDVPGAAGLGGFDAQKNKAQYQDTKIPVPDHWGGYRIEPFEVEFWCGRPNRLHDRFRYTRSPDSTKLAGQDEWKVERLAP